MQIKTDHGIEGREVLTDRVRFMVQSALCRFGKRITRVEVRQSDENGDKSGRGDKRCVMEARLTRRQPIAVF